MIELSLPRITRYALMLGGAGTLLTLLGWGWPSAAGFLVGAAISLISIRSWFLLSQMISGQAGRPGLFSVAMLVLRYGLIAAAAYVTIKVLGSSPGAMLAGLLVAFTAVLVDLLFGLKGPK